MRRGILYIIMLCFGAQLVSAQDLPFTQYEVIGTSINPGLVGMDNYMRASVDYRNATFSNSLNLTSTALYLKSPLLNKAKTKRWGGAALGLYHDEVSQGTPYDKFAIQPAFAYNLPVGKRHYFCFGVQGNYVQQKVDVSQFTTGSQWVPNQGYDPTSALGESFNRQNIHYVAVHAGLMFYGVDTLTQEVQYYVGATAFNLNQPDVTFTNQSYKLPISTSFIAGGNLLEKGHNVFGADAVGAIVEGNSKVGVGPFWSYRFENNNPFDPFTSGAIKSFARYYSDQRIAFGATLIQKNYSIGASFDLHLSNQEQMATPELALSIYKRIGMKPKQAVSSAATGGYVVGQTRDFGEKAKQPQEEQPFQNHPIDSVERQYQAAEVGNFQFELRKDFHYGFNETKLNDEAKAYLKDLATMLKANPLMQLRVVGHTDNVGSKRANEKVSYLRAKHVVDYLEAQDISHKRLQADGKGDADPLYPNDTEEHRAKNRRVEFIIYSKK